MEEARIVTSGSEGGVQTPMGTQGVSQCFGCGVDGEGEEDTEDGNFYCFACWLIYHAARARLRRDSAHVQEKRTGEATYARGRKC